MIRQLPSIIKQNDEIKHEVNELKNKLDALISKLDVMKDEHNASQSMPVKSEEEAKKNPLLTRSIIEEMEDRTRRSRNVVF